MYKYVLSIALVSTAVVVAYFKLLDTGGKPSTVPAVSYVEVAEEESLIPSTPTEPGEDPSGEASTPDPAPQIEIPESDAIAEDEPLPAQFNLAVPFTSQAPHANWELPYAETCEEASSYMVSEYYKGTVSGKIDPDVADEVILDLVDFQTDFLGFYLDTTAAETVSFIDPYFGYIGLVEEDPTVEMIKREIASGKPVIIPAAGRELGNPNFTGLGPLYHMLVIKGYTEDSFITNDPGTRNGENYVYDIQVIMDAIGDWNDGDPENGAKVVIFTQP